MTNQFTGTNSINIVATRLSRKRFLLFVLIFSAAFLVAATFFILINSTIAIFCIAISILLIAVVFYLRLKEFDIVKNITTQLNLQKEQFGLILNSINEGLIITGKNTEVLFMNPTAELITGWKNHEVKNKPLEKIYNVTNETIGNSFENIVSRVLRVGKAIELENNTVLKTKNSYSIIVCNSGLPLYDENGDISGAVLIFNDITKNSTFTRQTEDKYKTLIEHASDAVIIYSFDGTIYDFNNAAHNLSGYTRKEFENLKLTNLLFDEPIIINPAKAEKINAGENVFFYRKLKRKDGIAMDIEVNSKMLPNGRILAYVKDITIRLKAEQALKESNERYELVAKATSDMVWDWNLITGEIYRSKEGWEKIFTAGGYQSGGTEEDWFSRIHPDDKEKVKDLKLDILLSESNLFEFESRVLTDDGTYAYIQDKGYIMRNEAGRPVRLIGAAKNVTEKKLVEEALKSSEERYRYLFNNNPASGIIWDIDDLSILEVNDTARNIYGYSKDEFTKLTIMDLRPAEEHHKILDFLNIIKTEPDVKREASWKHMKKSGEEFYIHIVSHKVLYNGKMVMMAMGSDVTEKILLQERLETEEVAKQKEITDAVITAQEKERSYIGGELHDNVNQILASALLYLGIIKRDADNCNSSLNEIDKLINDAIKEIRVLTHSMIAPSLEETTLAGALDNIIKVSGKTGNFTIHKNIDCFDESAMPDKFKLSIYRIVQEQFNNIHKYAKAKNIYLTLSCNDKQIQLTIADDGIGFDTAKKSDGVGLMNIKTRAALYNGEVKIISAPGKGCEMYIIFNK